MHRAINKPHAGRIVRSAALAAVILGGQHAAAQVTTWVGPNAGSWSVVGNWNNGLPNGGGFTALVDAGNAANRTVSVDGNFSVGTLGISAGDQVNVLNNLALTLGTQLNNAGTLGVTAGTNNAFLNAGGGSVSIVGGGNVVLGTGGAGTAFVAGTGTIVNADNTIRGAGNIANNGLNFVNQGTIVADVSGATLTIDPVNAANAFQNTGTLAAANGGILLVTGNGFGGINSAGGRFVVGNGSEIRWTGPTGWTGGTISTSGTGAFRINAGQTIGGDGFANAGNVVVDNNAALHVTGDLHNSGSINVNAAANNALLRFNSGSTNLTGGGTINLASAGAGAAGVTSSAVGLLNNVNNTIRGFGNVAGNELRFVNGASGRIVADVAGQTLVIDPINAANGFVNNGTILATGGGIIQVSGFGFGGINNAGTMSAATGSEFQWTGATGFDGGTITSAGTGLHRINPGQTIGFSNFANTGTVLIENNAALNTAGTISNAGNILIGAGTNNSVMRVTGGGTVSLSGGGTITLLTNGTLAGSAFLGASSSGTLVNSNNLIRGFGNLASNEMSFINAAAGVVDANVGGRTLTLDAINVTNGFVNDGILRATNGGILQFSGNGFGGYTNNGTITAGANSLVQLLANTGISGGTLNGAGSFEVVAGNAHGLSNVSIGSAVNVANNATLFVGDGTITNSGTISISPGANNSFLRLSGGTLNLLGPGHVVLNAGTATAFVGSGSNGTLITSGATTIRGVGNVAGNDINVVNNGTITANVSGQTLVIDPRNGVLSFVNNGRMIATNGGVLQFTGNGFGGVDNNGTITADAGSSTRWTSNTGLTGGTLNGAGTHIALAGNTPGFTNVTNVGTFVVENGATMFLGGSLTNVGTLLLTPSAGNATVHPSGGVTLNGGGFVTLGGAGGARFGVNAGTLTNVNNTIRGFGELAGNSTGWLNQGTIAASGGTLTVDPVNATDGFVNNGTMLAEGGATLLFTGNGFGGVTNNASIVALAGGNVRWTSNTGVTGGTFSGAGTHSAAAGNAPGFTNVTNVGTFVVENGATMFLGGSLTNVGTLLLTPSAGNATVHPSGGVTLNGGGLVTLGGAGGARFGVNAGTLTNVNNTIRGFGELAGNATGWVNQGTIAASDGTLTIDPVNATDGFVNTGTLLVESGAQMTLTGNGFGGINTATGAFRVQSGGTFTSTGPTGFTAGSIQLDGTYNQIAGGSDAMNVRGSGTVNLSGGGGLTIRAGGGTLGTSTVAALSISSGGRLNLTDHDFVIDYTGASPTASLRPLIAAAFNAGAWNGNTTMITSSTAAAVAATPGADKTGIGYLDASDIGSPPSFGGVNVDATSTLLRYTLLGDSNLDRTVNIADFSRLAANFNLPSTWFNGDFNYDGTTGIADFSLLAANFNKTLAGGLARPSAVPEPGAAALALLAGAAALWRRRRPPR